MVVIVVTITCAIEEIDQRFASLLERGISPCTLVLQVQTHKELPTQDSHQRDIIETKRQTQTHRHVVVPVNCKAIYCSKSTCFFQTCNIYYGGPGVFKDGVDLSCLLLGADNVYSDVETVQALKNGCNLGVPPRATYRPGCLCAVFEGAQ